MKKTIAITVKEMALMSGVTIRTLHHYDEIGLLKAHRNASGYRIYNEKHALRLQQILLHKSFGLGLEEIATALDNPQFDTLQSLQRQKLTVVQQIDTMHAMLRAIDAAILRLTKPNKDRLDLIFDGFDPSLYEEEVATRWGQTDTYQESQRKTQHYTSEDWQQIKQEEERFWHDAAKAMRSGEAPDSKTAKSLSERYRKHIDRWFYTTTPSGYLALAAMWESDPRFSENIDKFGPGLTQWIVAAVKSGSGDSH
jgi:DNA-binding transcriptional MerR regulator